mgnify:CR=1 FL=1
MDLYWLTQAAAYWSLVLFLIPLIYIKEFILFAFLGGFIYTWAVQLLAVHTLGLWYYKPDIFTLWGLPVFFVLSWFAVTLIYGYLLFKYPRDQIWIIAFFVAWATLMNIFAHRLSQIFMPAWSIPETLMFAIFSHVLLLYAFKTMHNVEELGAKEHMVKFSLSILKNKKK